MTATRGSVSREAAEGAASGTLLMALFGAVWAAAGAGTLEGAAGVLSKGLLDPYEHLSRQLCLPPPLQEM